MPQPPIRLVSSVRSAAVIVAAALLWAVDATHFATAQGRLEAEYTATLAGIPIGRGNWVIEITDDQFVATATGGTLGILRVFSAGHGTSSSQGMIVGGQLAPLSFTSSIAGDKRIDDVRLAFAGGNIKEFSVDPPMLPHPDRIPVSDADRRNVIDPMTAALDAVGGNSDPVSPQACGRKAAVFDGRMRFDLRSEFKRIDMVKGERGYQGPVVVCAVYFVPISGYVPERYAIKYLAALRDAEVWFAPIVGTRVLVPYRFSLPTPIGTGVLQATRFVSTAQPARAATSARTQ